ncbi:MAG TPA: hypothetical protein VD947_00445 [Patescibacteria group bacterium]|nr:hypothetical protein [Patescibacteria group bacterium]
MTSTSGDSQFDFGSVTGPESYNHIAVGQEVLWPLVDFYWQGNWRTDSSLGHELSIPKNGMHPWASVRCFPNRE